MNQFKKSESGRNVLEMIAIIVLMALLISLGLWGFKKASLSAKVNTMSKDMSTAITERRYQIAQGGTGKEHKLNTKVGATDMVVKNITSGDDRGQFTILLTDLNKDTCEEMKNFNVFNYKKVLVGTTVNAQKELTDGSADNDCTSINALEFYFDGQNNGGSGSSGFGGGDDPLKGKCDGKVCGVCQSCNPNTGTCENDNTITKGACAKCQNGSVIQNPAVSLSECETCNLTTGAIEPKEVGTFCGTCGKCKSDASCDDTYQKEWTGKAFDPEHPNCCLEQKTYSYCTIKQQPPIKCEKNEEDITYSGDSTKCDYKKEVTDKCTTTTTTTYPNENTACDTCGKCTGMGTCNVNAGKTTYTYNKKEGSVCTSVSSGLVCPTDKPSHQCCLGTKPVCKECNLTTGTWENDNTATCGECGTGTCSNGSCSGGAKQFFTGAYKVNGGNCIEIYGDFCPSQLEACTPPSDPLTCSGCNTCQKCDTTTGNCVADSSKNYDDCGTCGMCYSGICIGDYDCTPSTPSTCSPACNACQDCVSGTCQTKSGKTGYTACGTQCCENGCNATNTDCAPKTKTCSPACNACQTCNTTTGNCEYINSANTVPCGTSCCKTGKRCLNKTIRQLSGNCCSSDATTVYYCQGSSAPSGCTGNITGDDTLISTSYYGCTEHRSKKDLCTNETITYDKKYSQGLIDPCAALGGQDRHQYGCWDGACIHKSWGLWGI